MSENSENPSRYDLGNQVGFNLRRANQRHVAIFSRLVKGLTPTQFAALARLYEMGPLSQNRLGRLTAMDSATIKGVVQRLRVKSLVHSRPDLTDQRLRLVELTAEGRLAFEESHDQVILAREETLAPLSPSEVTQFELLLGKLV